MIVRVIAAFIFLLILPIIFLISILISLEDGFPVFFEQKRVGQNCSFFKIYKFRTMKLDTPNVATHLLENPDEYLLKVGVFLRKYSLDELPNLLNVINGEMVFVGPRPALFNQNDLMELRILEGIDTLKPGITGWAQINGRDEISLRIKIEYEKEYLEKRSLLFDLRIIFLTISNVILKKNVAH